MNETTFTVTDGRQDIITRRMFDAPAALVYRAYTEPELVARWWGGQDPTEVSKLEARVGGQWRFAQRGEDGSEYGFHGVFHALTPGEGLVYTYEFEGMPGHVAMETIGLVEQDGRTEMTSTLVFQSVADRDGMVASGMEGGAKTALDTLEELVKTLT